MIDREALKKATERYWQEKPSQKIDCNYIKESYIKNLLPKEIEFIKRNTSIDNNLTSFPIDVLVLSVGNSWEPLLISTCLLNPKMIIPILNKNYGRDEGNSIGLQLEDLFKTLYSENLIIHNITYPTKENDLFQTIEPKPEEVFNFLKDNLLGFINDGKRVIIDITGGKKTMASGAYLFSSYTNVAVSYLDYQEYSDENLKPYGYSCHLRILKNPMKLFKLQEWDKVKNLYEKNLFDSASKLVKEIYENTQDYLKDEKEQIMNLISWLNFYNLWDNGHYNSAKNAFEKLNGVSKELCPIAVEKLGNENWPEGENILQKVKELEGEQDIESSFYFQNEQFLIYAQDELFKIERIFKYNEDYRSTLLRAIALTELLLKARLIYLWKENKFIFRSDDEEKTRDQFTARIKTKIDKGILTKSKSIPIVNSLQYYNTRDRWLTINLNGEKFIGYRSQATKELTPFWEKENKKPNKNYFRQLIDIRNKAIHFCLMIPKKFAEDAIEITKRNFEDFINNFWEKHQPELFVEQSYNAISWEKLCKICGITFLPFFRRNNNE